MRYAIKMKDGSVADMQVLPKLVRFDDGREFLIPSYKKENSKTVLKGENADQSITIEVQTEDIKETSIPGAKVVFWHPDEIIAKWSDAKRASVVSISRIDS